MLYYHGIPVGNANSVNDFSVWATSSLDRIDKTQTPGSNAKVNLFAARGEYESFQIGINASETNLTNVNISISDLFSSNDSIQSRKNINLYREHYVPVNKSSPNEEGSKNKPLGVGLYADALIPFVDPRTDQDVPDATLFNLDIGNNQPIWVDILVPRDAKAGVYQGKYTVTSDQGDFSGEISLKVWNFELPLKPSLKSLFLVWDDSNRNKNTYIELLKHKIMPGGYIDHKIQRELIDEWGLNTVLLRFFSGANHSNCEMKEAPSVQEIQETASQYESDLTKLVQSVDEIDDCTNLNKKFKQWSVNIKKAGVKHLAVSTPLVGFYEDNSRIDGELPVDYWAVLARRYEAAPERINAALDNGAEVWSYIAIHQNDYSPKWLIDFAPNNFRIMQGFINQSLGLSGVFYWRVDYWQGNPWQDEQTIFRGDNENYPGEGLLIYPGQQVGIEGVVPSIRLKWIRDGVEDYEYVETLKNLGQEDWALEQIRKVAADFRNWTQNPQELLGIRLQLGEEIDRLLSS